MRRILAIVLLATPAAWGAMDFNGSTEHARNASSAEVTATPLTIACWAKPDSAGGSTLGLSGATNGNYFKLRLFSGTLGGVVNPILAQQAGGAGSNFAQTSTGWTAGAWHHGTVVFTSSTSRTAYIDGGSSGNNTTSETPASIAQTLAGAGQLDGSSNPSDFFDGLIAECGIWNVALTDAEVATLGKGFAPPCVRRASLVAYYPMIRDATTLKDYFSATSNNLTLTGGTVSDHPRIIRCQ